jgi:hypothetical protein
MARPMAAGAYLPIDGIFSVAIGRPIRATALVMLHLEAIAAQLTDRPQIFVLRPRELGRDRTTPHRVLNDLAGRLGVAPPELIAAQRAEMTRHTERRRLAEAQQAAPPPPPGPSRRGRVRRPRPGRGAP